MKEEKIISALIGLVGACNNNPKTADTDNLVIKALSFPLIYPNADTEIISGIVNEIRSEKNAVAPMCAMCTVPCGNTSDYDMNRIYETKQEICKIKSEILYELQKLAVYLYRNKESDINCEILYKGFSYISYDMGRSCLNEFLEEVKSIEHKMKFKEDF